MACPTNQAAISCTSFPSAAEARSSIACLDVVFSEIAALQQLILQAINDCHTEILVTSGTPLTNVTSITSVNVVSGGTGYFPVAATATISHPTGTGAIISPIVSNGRITSFAVTAAGSGYAPIEATATISGGSGTATFQTIVSADGKVLFINPLIGGTGYTAGSTINIIHPTGIGAIATVDTVDGSGRILTTNVSNGGSGYQPVVAKVIVSHPIGMGFSGTVHVTSGAVIGLAVTSTGFGYETLYPTLDITSTSGSGAQFSFTSNGSGTIQSIAVVNGGIGYIGSNTAVVVTAPGTSGVGASISLNVSQGSTVDSIHYYKVWSGQVVDAKAIQFLNQITDYFKCLGYTVQLINNPGTQKSLAWSIKW